MNTYRSWYSIICTAALVCALLWLQAPANAVPSFARRAGGASCSMCHWHQNALNATGKDFLRRGLRLAGEEANALAAELKMSQYASLVLAPNLSAVGDSTKFSGGEAILWLGGPIDSRFSALAETEFVVDDEAVAVEEIYAQYVSGPGDKYYSARVGQFQPMLLLSQVSGPPRLSLSRPEALSGRATNGNGFRPRDRVRGVEFGAVNDSIAAYLGIGNGQGQNADDNHMDIYATVEHDIGSEGSSIGVYGYWGEAVLAGGFRDSYNRYGIIGNYTGGSNRVVGGILFGNNDDPGGADLDNSGWFIELAHVVRPETAVYARWDRFSRDLAAGGERETDGPTLGVSWITSALTRINLEGQWLDTDGSNIDSITAELQIAL